MITYLFLGSFNPVHVAHVEAVKWALSLGNEAQVLVAVCPQNPLKSSVDLAPLNDRLAMAHIVFDGMARVQVTDFEKHLTPPYYTINSVEYLIAKYPQKQFAILCGSDILEQLPQWHRADELQKLVEFVEFPRNIIDVSSTELRSGLKSEFLDVRVAQYIKSHNLYVDPLVQAKRLYAAGEFGAALNVLDSCDSSQGEALKEMIYDILAFRNTDIYNP